MPSDVSDEALAELASDHYNRNPNHEDEASLHAFAKRIRDLTAARCVEACKERARTRGVDPAKPPLCFTFGDHVTAMGVESMGCAESIEALFPGAAAAEGEARDG